MSLKLKEEFLKLLEKDKDFRLTVAGIIGYRDILERFEEYDKKFNEVINELREHTKRYEEHDKGFNEIIIGWGKDLERTTVEIFREALEKKGIEPGKISKFKFKDKDGSYTGRKGEVIDVDILIKDEKLYIIEVKSHAELDHIERLIDKVPVVEKVLNRKAEKVYLIAVNINDDAFERAKEEKIEVIYGSII
jgi:hypothetical protein